MDVEEAEAICLHEALNWVISLSMERVIFETDAKAVLDAISTSKRNLTEFGFLISSCQSILHTNESFQVCFVRRQANKVIHALAKAACFNASPITWFQPPMTVLVLR